MLYCLAPLHTQFSRIPSGLFDWKPCSMTGLEIPSLLPTLFHMPLKKWTKGWDRDFEHTSFKLFFNSIYFFIPPYFDLFFHYDFFPTRLQFPYQKAYDPCCLSSLEISLCKQTLSSAKQMSKQTQTQSQTQDKPTVKTKTKIKTKNNHQSNIDSISLTLSIFLLWPSRYCNIILCLLTLIFKGLNTV